MARTGKTVRLVGVMMPLEIAADIELIAKRTGKKKSRVSRDFVTECWPGYKAAHPELIDAPAEDEQPKTEAAPVIEDCEFKTEQRLEWSRPDEIERG